MPYTFTTVFGPLVIPSLYSVGVYPEPDDASADDSDDEYETIQAIDYIYWDGSQRHTVTASQLPNAIYVAINDDFGYILTNGGDIFMG